MKKLLLFFLVFVSVSFAKPSSYNCYFVGKIDSNWTLTYEFSTNEIRESLFSFKKVGNTIISSVDDSIYNYSGTEKSLNIYKSKKGNAIIISNKSIKIGEARYVDYVRNNKILHRYEMNCKRVK